jgi:hypothetical protein
MMTEMTEGRIFGYTRNRNTKRFSENFFFFNFCRRQAQGARIIKLAPLEKGELPEWSHLRHIMSELTKLIFYRNEN